MHPYSLGLGSKSSHIPVQSQSTDVLIPLHFQRFLVPCDRNRSLLRGGSDVHIAIASAGFSKKVFRHCSPQSDLKLMAEQKILRLQVGGRLERINNEHSDEHRKYRCLTM